MPSPSPIRRELQFAGNLSALSPTQEFVQVASDFGLEFEPGELVMLGRYLALLLEANRQFNLTSVTDHKDVWIRHIFDSLTLMSGMAELPSDVRVADVGSGGGLPGIPLAICRPDLAFTLIESTGKKAEFLRAVVDLLGLTNVEIIDDRAETLAHDRVRHREKYHAVVARAVGRLSVISELTVPFALAPSHEGVGGLVLLIKGQRADDELLEAKQALHLLHARHLDTMNTPTGRIVLIEKLRPTPKIYPRKPGEPKRRPLGGSGR